MGAGRSIGVLASGGRIVIWLLFLFAHPYTRAEVTFGSRLIACAMIVIAVLGAITSLLGRPFWMYVLFVASFFPVGLYLAGTPGIFRWIAVLDLCFLLAAVAIQLRSR